MMVNEYTTEDFVEAIIESEREEAHAQGHAKGHAQGHVEGRVEVARNALAEGYSAETIQRITGLDIETIKNL